MVLLNHFDSNRQLVLTANVPVQPGTCNLSSDVGNGDSTYAVLDGKTLSGAVQVTQSNAAHDSTGGAIVDIKLDLGGASFNGQSVSGLIRRNASTARSATRRRSSCPAACSRRAR